MDNFEVYGFIEDYDLYTFENVFINKNIKEVHIDAYMNDPYMLFSRMVENSVTSLLQDGRLVIRKNNGKSSLVLMDIPFNSIMECIVKKYSNSHYQFVFVVENVCYKILAII